MEVHCQDGNTRYKSKVRPSQSRTKTRMQMNPAGGTLTCRWRPAGGGRGWCARRCSRRRRPGSRAAATSRACSPPRPTSWRPAGRAPRPTAVRSCRDTWVCAYACACSQSHTCFNANAASAASSRCFRLWMTFLSTRVFLHPGGRAPPSSAVRVCGVMKPLLVFGVGHDTQPLALSSSVTDTKQPNSSCVTPVETHGRPAACRLRGRWRTY